MSDIVVGEDGCAARQLDEIEAMENVLGLTNVDVEDGFVHRLSNLRNQVHPNVNTAVLGAELESDGHVSLTITCSVPAHALATSRASMSPSSKQVVVVMLVTIPATYPELQAPKVSVTSPHFNKREAGAMADTLNNLATKWVMEEHVGECLFQLCTNLDTLVQETVGAVQGQIETTQSCDIAASNFIGSPSAMHVQPITHTCLYIDHMNDHTAYMKKLKGWIHELGITGCLLYRMRTKVLNAVSGGSRLAPKGRAEGIYVLLEGQHHQVTEFFTRLRTSKMTSQDVREKKSKILWDSLVDTPSRSTHPTVQLERSNKPQSDQHGHLDHHLPTTPASTSNHTPDYHCDCHCDNTNNNSTGHTINNNTGHTNNNSTGDHDESNNTETHASKCHFQDFTTVLYTSRTELETFWNTCGLEAIISKTHVL